MIVIAIDPGYATGVCVADVAPMSKEYNLLEALTIEWEDRHEALYNLLLKYSIPENNTAQAALGALVIESFVLYPNKAAAQSYSDFPSVDVIGAVRAFAYLLGLSSKIVMQGAAVRKSARIQAEHYEQVRATKHTRDAYQHLRYYVIMQHSKQLEAKRKADRRT